MAWLRSNWLDRLLLPALLTVLRFCWLWPWLSFLRQILAPSHTAPLLAPGVILAVPVISLALSHLAPVREVPTDKPNAVPQSITPLWARLGIAIAGLITTAWAIWWQDYRFAYGLGDLRWLAAVGDSLIHWPANEVSAAGLMLVSLVYLWLRGMLDAAQPMSHDELWGAILAGVGALVAYLLLARMMSIPLVENLGGLVVLFFAAGMTALAFSSLKTTVGLDYALGMGQRRAAKTPQATRYWLLSVVIVVGGLLGLGLALALLIAPEGVARVLALVNSALGFVWWLIGLVLIAIGYVLFMIVYYILLLLQPLLERLVVLLHQAEFFTPLEQPEATPAPMLPEVTPDTLPDAYRWLALALVLLAVVAIFALVLRKLRTAPAELLDEERESILSADLLGNQLAQLWQKWFGGRTAAGGFLSLEGEPENRRRVRQRYQELLAAARTLGRARQRDQTPTEYQRPLASDFTEVESAVATMTAQYNHARYAPEPPTPEAAESAEQAWHQVQGRLSSTAER
jgi:hypothetical protein